MRGKNSTVGVDTPDPHTRHDQLWEILSINLDNRSSVLAYCRALYVPAFDPECVITLEQYDDTRAMLSLVSAQTNLWYGGCEWRRQAQEKAGMSKAAEIACPPLWHESAAISPARMAQLMASFPAEPLSSELKAWISSWMPPVHDGIRVYCEVKRQGSVPLRYDTNCVNTDLGTARASEMLLQLAQETLVSAHSQEELNKVRKYYAGRHEEWDIMEELHKLLISRFMAREKK